MYLDFNEVNIFLQNSQSDSKEKLLQILTYLEQNTTDILLLFSIKSLKTKVGSLPQEQYVHLRNTLKSSKTPTTQITLVHL